MPYEAADIWVEFTFKMRDPNGEEYEDTHTAKVNKAVHAKNTEDLGEYVQDMVFDLTDDEMKEIIRETYSETDTVLEISAQLKEYTPYRI